MNDGSVFRPGDLDAAVDMPSGLLRLHRQNLMDLTPWHLLTREAALQRLRGLRRRYARKYVPIARRQDNDDVACLDPSLPGEVVIIHDFASEGTEPRAQFKSFWDWFRLVIEDMIDFE